MTHYPDTSFLCAIYREQVHSQEAVNFRAAMGEPICYTDLLEFEFLQSLCFQAWRFRRDDSQGFSASEADAMRTNWETDIATGSNIHVPCDTGAITRLGKFLAQQYVVHSGHRPFDILHVATALHLGMKNSSPSMPSSVISPGTSVWKPL